MTSCLGRVAHLIRRRVQIRKYPHALELLVDTRSNFSLPPHEWSSFKTSKAIKSRYSWALGSRAVMSLLFADMHLKALIWPASLPTKMPHQEAL